MHQREARTQEKEERGRTVRKSDETKGRKLTLTRKKKRQANNDAFHHKEGTEEEGSAGRRARVRNREEKVSHVISHSYTWHHAELILATYNLMSSLWNILAPAISGVVRLSGSGQELFGTVVKHGLINKTVTVRVSAQNWNNKYKRYIHSHQNKLVHD